MTAAQEMDLLSFEDVSAGVTEMAELTGIDYETVFAAVREVATGGSVPELATALARVAKSRADVEAGRRTPVQAAALALSGAPAGYPDVAAGGLAVAQFYLGDDTARMQLALVNPGAEIDRLSQLALAGGSPVAISVDGRPAYALPQPGSYRDLDERGQIQARRDVAVHPEVDRLAAKHPELFGRQRPRRHDHRGSGGRFAPRGGSGPAQPEDDGTQYALGDAVTEPVRRYLQMREGAFGGESRSAGSGTRAGAVPSAAAREAAERRARPGHTGTAPGIPALARGLQRGGF